MTTYQVNWAERYAQSALVEAESAEQARALVLSDPAIFAPDHGEWINVEDSVDVSSEGFLLDKPAA